MYCHPFEYYIDSPNLSQEITYPFIEISGWISADKEMVISSPTICNSDIYIHSLTIVSRSDVEVAYPNHSVLCFHQYLSILDLSLGEDYSIHFLINGDKHSFPLPLKISSEFFDIFLKSKRDKLQKIIGILHCPICESTKSNLSKTLQYGRCGAEFSASKSNYNFLPKSLRDKLQKIIGILRRPIFESTEVSSLSKISQCGGCGAKFSASKSNYNFLPKSLIEYGNVKPTANVSTNNYDTVALDIIEQFKDGIILDNGCGLRNVYYENVVNFEIVDYPTTDVLGIGEKLPFKTDVFDAVFSLAVLEHVKNPFECAQEIVRVLKPGGILYVAVPFLQPFHGYPDHYYNMTSSGLKNLFSDKLQIIECSVPRAGLPIWCLSWFLNSYTRGLPEKVAEEFKNMKVSDLLNHPIEYLDKDFVNQLSPVANEELASVNFLIAKKIDVN